MNPCIEQPVEWNGIYPIGSMYGIFTYIYHKNQPNVGQYKNQPNVGKYKDQPNVGKYKKQPNVGQYTICTWILWV